MYKHQLSELLQGQGDVMSGSLGIKISIIIARPDVKRGVASCIATQNYQSQGPVLEIKPT